MLSQLMEMLVQIAYCTDPDKLTEGDHQEISMLLSSWSSLSPLFPSSPLFHYLSPSSLYSLLTHLQSPSEVTEPIQPLAPSSQPPPHHPKDCKKHSSYSSDLVYHGTGFSRHFYHRVCLHDYIVKQTNANVWPIMCLRCPQPLGMDIVSEAFPEAASLKTEKVRELINGKKLHFTE